MKPTLLLLIASLTANVAIVAYLATRPGASQSSSSASPASVRSSPASASAAAEAALVSGDAAALEAAGVPPEIARELALGRVFARLADRLRAQREKTPTDERWWRSRANAPGAREQQLLARRELSDALMAAFGDDFGLLGGDASLLSFLPPAKRDALRRINQDYDEMMAKFSAGGIQLASDREKLRLLRAERDRDIAALLTPEERLAYEMRTSASGATVRARYGEAIENEAEFQKLYALQKAFDENFPREALSGRIPPETLRARSQAERELENEIRAAVGDERYAALRRAADPDLRTVDSLVSRLGLASAATDQVITTRDALAAESQRINADASVPPPQRRSQIQELAARAKSDLTRTLGAEAAEAYAQRSPWMSMLQSGMAYSTTPPADSPRSVFVGPQSVYPVFPEGATGPGAGRQVVFNAVADTVVGGDPAATPATNMQVMSFTSTTNPSPSDPTAAGASGGAPALRQRIEVAPATPMPSQPKP